MTRHWTRWAAGGATLSCAVGSAALWRWKRRRLADLATGSDLVGTDRGVVEVARRGSGYPVLVLHGSPGGYDQALALGDAVFGDGVELLAPSRPGFLRTPLEARTPSDQAALFDALLDELGVDEALVVGLSAGGPPALHLAAEFPERVAGLALVSAITTAIDDRTFDTGNPLVDPILTAAPVLDALAGLAELFRRADPDRFLDGMHGSLSTLEGADLDEYVESVATTPVQRERSLRFATTITPTSARVDGTRNDERWCPELPLVDYGQIGCPTLAVHGTFDGAVPLSHAEYAVETIPGSDLHRVETDHLVWIGPDADRTCRVVRRFADSVAVTA
jgi:pimeloyl-ACP methyl ester carboxylesterase